MLESPLFIIDGDLSRGLLQFAGGKPLGKDGLAWLEVHLANVYDEKNPTKTSAKLDSNARVSVKKYIL